VREKMEESRLGELAEVLRLEELLGKMV